MARYLICSFILLSVYINICDANYCNVDDFDCQPIQPSRFFHNKMLIAAIDFGTTFSGWAFSFKHEYLANPSAVTYKQWSGDEGLSKKTPTTVLIKPDGKTLESFGYEAESRYAELAEEDKHHNYYYFKRFKMMLYGKQHLTKETTIVDDSNKALPAITVFALAIQYLKQNLLEYLQDHTKNLDPENDIGWVLTVPAIWDDTAKHFMRKAAVQGGIKDLDLMIALEPEAASIYSRLVPIEKITDEQGISVISPLLLGTRYMVLDAGGGTVDITVHEILAKGHLKELLKASGGPWGGTKVDDAFLEMLNSLVETDVFQEFKRKCASDYLELMRSFEIKKRKISNQKESTTAIRLPECLITLKKAKGKSIMETISSSTYAKDLKYNNGKIIVSADKARSFFREALASIVENVRSLLREPCINGTNTILLVGGFSESPMLKEAMKTNFVDQIIVTSKNAGLVVVMGAVIFGHDNSIFTDRVSKYTYGVNMCVTYIEGLHDPEKKVYYDDEYFCCDLFSKFVEIGQTVKFGEHQGEKRYCPLREESKAVDLFVYACTQKKPIYVTDDGCSKLGSVRVKINDRSVPKIERLILVTFTFSDTEIKVKAIEERTREENVVTLDFLC